VGDGGVGTTNKRYGGGAVVDVLRETPASLYRVTLVKSVAHAKPKQKGAARSLRLRRIGDQSIVQWESNMSGAVRMIEHLVSLVPLDKPTPGVVVLGGRKYAGSGPPPQQDRAVPSAKDGHSEATDMTTDLRTAVQRVVRLLRPDLPAPEVESHAIRIASAKRSTKLTESEIDRLARVQRRFSSADD
jgi:ribosomal protein L30/L7E